MKKVAVFASGNGTNFENLLRQHDLNVEFALFVCDKKEAKAIDIAMRNNIPQFVFNPKDFASKGEYEKAIINELEKHGVEYIILAGYMRILSSEFVSKYRYKIINIHPSMLPNYKGAHAIEDAFYDNKNIFGVTIHYVDEEVDSGVVILQERVEDTLGLSLDEVTQKVHELEYKLYPKALKSIF